MKTKITRSELFRSSIWTVHYYSHFARQWVVSGQFDTYEEAVVDADSWGDPIQARLGRGEYANGPLRETE